MLAELNDISAALQSLRVGIHPLSPQLLCGVLTQHPAPSDQQATQTKRENATCVQSHLCQPRCILTARFRSHTADMGLRVSYLIFMIKLDGISALVVRNLEGV